MLDRVYPLFSTKDLFIAVRSGLVYVDSDARFYIAFFNVHFYLC